MLASFKEMLELAKTKHQKKICIVNAADDDVLKSVEIAYETGIASSILVGDEEKIVKVADENKIDISHATIVDEKDPLKSAKVAVNLVSERKADILVKGKIQTPDFMRAVLNKESGLRSSDLLSHVAVFETPNYHKLIYVTDGGMNISPTLPQKVSIVKNAVKFCHSLGIETPKVACVGAIELVNLDMPATTDAAMLSIMNKRKQIKDCIIEGPFGLDNAVSRDAANTKGVESEIAGDVDILLLPDIQAGNILVKGLCYLAGAQWSGIIVGAKCPIVLASRADTYETKLNSIATAVAMLD